jgi:hypothetical protein
MLRKPRKISTFDTRFFVLFVFAVSLYHYGIKFILVDTQYILRAPYVITCHLITRITNFLPKQQFSVPFSTLQRTKLAAHLPVSSVPVLQYFDTGYARTLFIPKQQFHVGDIVVAGSCLIGRIAKIGKQIASVQLITDQASCIPVVFGGVNAMAFGKGARTLQISRFQNNLTTTCPPKTSVYTSGIDGIYPKNLLVGFIRHATHNKALLYSCFDFKALDYVDVIAYGDT